MSNVFGLRRRRVPTPGPLTFPNQVPWTYIWSPSLVPRPKDWPSSCEVVGFINVELTKLTAYEPDEKLKNFLDAGDRSGGFMVG